MAARDRGRGDLRGRRGWSGNRDGTVVGWHAYREHGPDRGHHPGPVTHPGEHGDCFRDTERDPHDGLAHRDERAVGNAADHAAAHAAAHVVSYAHGYRHGHGYAHRYEQPDRVAHRHVRVWLLIGLLADSGLDHGD